MRFWVIFAGIAAGAMVALLSTAQSAQAQPRNYRNDSTVVYYTDENGRRRTRIILQKRSYLDGGTEVMPGDIQSHQTNFIDMHQKPRSAVSNDNIVPGRPINDPFFLPGKNNPYFR